MINVDIQTSAIADNDLDVVLNEGVRVLALYFLVSNQLRGP
jgi:hypothetical protein